MPAAFVLVRAAYPLFGELMRVEHWSNATAQALAVNKRASRARADASECGLAIGYPDRWRLASE